MGIADYLILAAVLGYCGWLVFGRKKSGGCCGDCVNCAGCRRKEE